MKKIFIITLAFTLTLAAGMFCIADFVMHNEKQPQTHTVGEAENGVVAQVATSSTIIVGPSSVVRIFEPKAFCNARIVTTRDQPIMISFVATSTLTPSALVGHQQTSSTTKEYNSGLYGCGPYSVYGYGASTTITISESI